ncbi:MAG: nucleotidyltransferase domain-containing protein [archaeon]
MKFNQAAKKIFEKYGSLLDDILVFGSSMRGEDNPNDVDILIVFKNNVDKKIELEFKKELNISGADINSVSLQELEGDGFIAKEGMYLEGFSLVKDKLISESMGFSSIALIKYSLANIKGSKRISFYYALQGRNEMKGFLSTVGAKRFAESVIICDYNILEKIKPFFEQWNIEFTITPALIPKRLRHLLL